MHWVCLIRRQVALKSRPPPGLRAKRRGKASVRRSRRQLDWTSAARTTIQNEKDSNVAEIGGGKQKSDRQRWQEVDLASLGRG